MSSCASWNEVEGKVGEWLGMEKASWVEDIAWSRRCKWDTDMARGLENMLAIDRNIEFIVNNGPKSVKGRPARREFVRGFVRWEQGGPFSSVYLTAKSWRF